MPQLWFTLLLSLLFSPLASGQVSGKPKEPVRVEALSPYGKLQAVADGWAVKVVEAKTQREVHSLVLHPHADLKGIAFSPDGKTIVAVAAVSDDGDNPCPALGVWEAATGKELNRVLQREVRFPRVQRLAFHPSGRYVAWTVVRGAVEDSQPVLWDVVTGESVFWARTQTGTPPIPEFSADGKTLTLSVPGKEQSPQEFPLAPTLAKHESRPFAKPVDAGKPLYAWLRDLEDRDQFPSIRRAADAVLQGLGAKDVEAVPVLLTMLRHIPAPVTQRPGGMCCVPVRVNSARIRQVDPTVGPKASQALTRIGKPAVPLLVKEASLGNWGAHLILARMKGELVPTLREMFKNPSQVKAACLLVEWIGPPAKVLTPELLAVLESSAVHGYEPVGSALLALGTPEKSVLARLLGTIAKGKPGRGEAAVILARFAPKDQAIQDAIVGLVRDSDAQVRSRAARAIQDLGTQALPALPSLRAMLKDKNLDQDQSKILDLLIAHVSRFDPALLKQKVNALLAVAADPKYPEEQRTGALFGVFSEGKQSNHPPRALITLLEDRNERVAGMACLCLGTIWADSSEAIEALFGVLQGKHKPMREFALMKLVEIAGERQTTLPKLLPRAKEAIPAITEMLDDSRNVLDSRRAALSYLTQLGPEARAALPALRSLLAEVKEEHRAPVERAIKAIEGK